MEKPILFSTEMVRAILDGRKTQTRRVVKPSVFEKGTNWFWNPNENICLAQYRKGDVLWVRETWRCVKYDNMDGDLNYGVEFKDGTRRYFKFDDSERYHQFGKYALKKGWQPSIYLPKEAARVFLRVANVRVERLQEITEEAARAEGITRVEDGKWESEFRLGWVDRPIKAFRALWDNLNAKRGYGWDTNPFCWVIEFERIDG